MDKLPKIAKYKPYYCELTKAKRYLWCSCGLSENQPFCDGSHVGTDFKPVVYTAKEEGEEVLFCGCKRTCDKPFCDGAHNNLIDGYEQDDPNSDENRSIPVVESDENGMAMLNGGCYVLNVNASAVEQHDGLKVRNLIGRKTGAQYQSLFYLEIQPGESPILSFGSSEAILLVTQGKGEISISGEKFQIESEETGVYIGPDEAFSVSNDSGDTLKAFLCVCPLGSDLELLNTMPNNFNVELPTRLITIDAENRISTGDRFFQILVDKKMGSNSITQFIGDIPLSKAALHQHLYEESLMVLSGEGYMWTEGMKTAVRTGDIIFLPRKQVHSLECTNPEGMMLAGIIYPGDNPSINY